MRVELLNIGTELLMGLVVNSNAAYLGRKLGELGVTLGRQTCIDDSPKDILESLRETAARADLVLTTGGLGPTSDDRTRQIVLEWLGLGSHVDETVLRGIEERFRNRNLPVLESAKSQAIVPDDGIVFYNQNGTAPGLAVRFNGMRRQLAVGAPPQWLVILPGPPRELYPMWDNQVVPFLRKQYASYFPILDHRIFKIAGVPESLVEAKVEPVLKDIPGLEIGYCARPGEVDLRLVVRASDAVAAKRLADDAEERARCALGDSIYGAGDITLEEVIVKLLKSRQKKVAVAESCTAGYLAHRLTLIPGSSEVFGKGWVTYSNDAKTEMLGVSKDLWLRHGSVSDPVARAMAEGARLKSGADYALSVTGIAGPSGGTPETPVGTVYIALASPSFTDSQRLRFVLDRESFKFATAQSALDMLRKKLLS